jgi:predicted nuclease of predicted toxin-antitoxin system
VKFLVDMPLSPALAAWLCERGHDAVHAANLDMRRASDEAILHKAQSENRVVITADLDYPRLLALSAAEPGLILFRGGNWSERDVTALIGSLLDEFADRDFARSVFVVERKRVRRRRLPLLF